jgi:hypothetical protein
VSHYSKEKLNQFKRQKHTYNLQFNRFTLQVDSFNFEIDANGADEAVCVSVVLKTINFSSQLILILFVPQNGVKDSSYPRPSRQLQVI